MATTTVVSSDTEIQLSSLPLSIQDQIPYSIRTRKDIYQFSKLPFNIQYLIKSYIENKKEVSYNVLFDSTPSIAVTGDFTVIDNYFDLAVEYLKNYLMLTKGQYPFDPTFYSKLKYYLQTRDTSTRYTLVSSEVNRIANVLSTDLNIPVKISELKIKKSNVSDASVTYHVFITLTVNNVSKELSVYVV